MLQNPLLTMRLHVKVAFQLISRLLNSSSSKPISFMTRVFECICYPSLSLLDCLAKFYQNTMQTTSQGCLGELLIVTRVSGTTSFSNYNNTTHVSLYRANGIIICRKNDKSFFYKNVNIVFDSSVLLKNTKISIMEVQLKFALCTSRKRTEVVRV